MTLDTYTLRATIADNAGNSATVDQTVDVATVISGETTSSVSTTSIIVTWTTDDLTTSRVIYDSVSHSSLGSAPNYGYTNSTAETDISPKVTSHSVTITGLSAGTTYYYRTVSKGSPEAVGAEKTFATTSSSSSSGNGDGGGGGGGSTAAPSCNDTKPGSAPVLARVAAGLNSVILTWSEALDPVSYYLVVYGTSLGSLQFGNPNVGGKGTTSYTVLGLSGGMTYYFKVRAGNGCAPGDYSNELSATPIGVALGGPASGFIEGVLGKATTSAEVRQEEQIKGEEAVNKQAPSSPSSQAVVPTIFALILFVVLGFWFFKRRA